MPRDEHVARGNCRMLRAPCILGHGTGILNQSSHCKSKLSNVVEEELSMISTREAKSSNFLSKDAISTGAESILSPENWMWSSKAENKAGEQSF